MWNCICKCGNFTKVTCHNLRNGNTKSCGCLKKETARRMVEKRRKQLGIKTPITAAYSTHKCQAKKKGLRFEFTKEKFEKLVCQKCFYCGILPKKLFNGIDRINSERGYTIKNCVSCCTHCNYAKNSMSQKEFYKWIKRVYEYQEKQCLNR